MIRISAKKMVSVLEYILVGLIILDCRSVYSCAIYKDYHIPETTVVVLVCLFLVKLWKTKISKRIITKWFEWSLLLWVLMSLYITINVEKELLLTFIGKFVIGLPVISLLVCIYNSEGKPYHLLLVFCRLMVAEAIVSILFWILASQLHLLGATSYITAFWGGEYKYPCYYGIYFERQAETFFSFSGLRNQGIFNEAPMHSLCLVFALAVKLFLAPKTNRKELLGIITTITTTGYIILLVMYPIRFMITKNNNRGMYYIKVVSAVFLGIFALAFAVFLFIRVAGTSKWLVRGQSLIAGFWAWLKAPLLGNGYGDLDAMRSVGRIYRNTETVNSVMVILMQGGITLFIFYAVPLICNLSISIKNRSWNMTAFIIVFLLEFVVTTFAYTFLMLLLIGTFTGEWLCNTARRTLQEKYSYSQLNITEPMK